MSLYLKYRPRLVEELDLENVRKVLFEIIASNRTAHAYLFTGPRGAGKTSAARILARIVNCEKNRKKLGEPCNECDACKSILNGSAVDVIELDAASNRGIDDVRELKEKIKLAPAILPKKVYIIDEVHMMTTDAFNALLKTLEEPPTHSLFILCTTESHKVPETIASRCVRIGFTKATPQEMKRSFGRVLAGEGAEIEQEALNLLSLAVDGSFRDGVKLLDQVLSRGLKVTREVMEETIYGASGHSGKRLSQALGEKNLEESLKLLRDSLSRGVDLTYLLIDLMKELREMVVNGQMELIELIYNLDDTARKLSTSPVPAILVEITVIKWCVGSDKSDSQKTLPVRQAGQKTREPDKSVKSEKKEKFSSAPVIQSASKKPEYWNTGIQDDMNGHDIWHKMMSTLSGENYSMGALLSKARPGIISGNELTIEVKYDFHREQIMNSKFRGRIEEMVTGVVGSPMLIRCEVNPEMDSLKKANNVATISPPSAELDMMAQAEEIFNS